VSGYGVGYGVEVARWMVGCGMTATVVDCGDPESMPHFLRSPSEGFRAR